MTKQDLNAQMLSWNPEILFAAHNGREMYMSVDVFNHHINWEVKYGDGYYAQFYEDFDRACDFFLNGY